MSDSVWPQRRQRSPVPGILQARTLEWVAISFSNAWKWKVKVKSLSRVRLLETPWTAANQAPQSMGFSRQEYWGGLPLPSPITTSYISLKYFLVAFHMSFPESVSPFLPSFLFPFTMIFLTTYIVLTIQVSALQLTLACQAGRKFLVLIHSYRTYIV